jgi:hypothetical protein
VTADHGVGYVSDPRARPNLPSAAQAAGSGAPSGHDLRRLCRWLRAGLSDDRTRRPLPATLAHLSAHRPQQLRAGVLRLANRAVNHALISRRDAEAWASAAGLYGRLERRERVADALGVSAARLDEVRVRVADAVAAEWDEAILTAENELAPATPAAPHLALARTHAETIALAPPGHRQAAAHVLGTVRDVTLGLPARPSFPASDAERARRHRLRPAILARLAQESSHPVTAPARLLTPAFDELAADPDAAEQLWLPRPDPDWLASLVARAHRHATSHPRHSRALGALAIVGYARYDDPPDRGLAAEAWRLAIAHDVPRRDMAALWRLEHLRTLLPENHPTILSAATDVATVLREHGYLSPARQLLWSTLAALPTVRLPAAERDQLALRALTAFGSATPWSTQGGEPADAVTDVITSARSAGRLLDRSAAGTEAHRTQLRRRLIAGYAIEVMAARSDRRRPRPSRGLNRLEDEVLGTLRRASPRDAVMTWFTFARFAADRGDQARFTEALDRVAPLVAGPLRHYDFRLERTGFALRARRRGWPVPEF